MRTKQITKSDWLL